MTGVVVVSVLWLAVTAFMGSFFIALCRERRSSIRHGVKIRPQPRSVVYEWPEQPRPEVSGATYAGRKQA